MMVSQVDVQVDEAFEAVVDVDRIRRRAIQTLEAVRPEAPLVVSVVISDDATVQGLNRDYLGIDAPTDVLAFSQANGAALPAVEGTSYLGDVIVSYQRAVAQAVEYDEPVERELDRLVVHGVLHLLGYDDQTDAGREALWAMQERIIER